MSENTKSAELNELKSQGFFSTRRLAFIAVFTALSAVLYIFAKFPLPFMFPSFLDFQLSDAPALIAGFILGPFEAILVILLKIIIKIVFVGSSTMYVGELADLLIGAAFVLPPSIMYLRSRTQKTAVYGLIFGSLSAIFIAVIINYYALIPFYVSFFFKGNFDILLNMVRPLYKSVTKQNFYLYYIPLAVIPFNLIRCLLSSLLTFVLYKNLSKAFKQLFK